MKKILIILIILLSAVVAFLLIERRSANINLPLVNDEQIYFTGYYSAEKSNKDYCVFMDYDANSLAFLCDQKDRTYFESTDGNTSLLITYKVKGDNNIIVSYEENSEGEYYEGDYEEDYSDIHSLYVFFAGCSDNNICTFDINDGESIDLYCAPEQIEDLQSMENISDNLLYIEYNDAGLQTFNLENVEEVSYFVRWWSEDNKDVLEFQNNDNNLLVNDTINAISDIIGMEGWLYKITYSYSNSDLKHIELASLGEIYNMHATLTDYKNGVCSFVLQDGKYTNLTVKCSKDVLNNYENYINKLVVIDFYYDLETPSYNNLINIQIENDLPSMTVRLDSVDGNICKFITHGGNSEPMYCTNDMKNQTGEFTIYYVPNIMDEYPIAIRIK